MKKILFLGGSYQQVVAITTAKKLGYYSILCDYLPDNPGKDHAEKFYQISTTDMDAVLNVAKHNKIDGIIAYASDPAAPTAAYVAEKLNLPTNSYKSVNILSNKNLFRDFLKKNGFHVPFNNVFKENDTIFLNDLNFPLIIKPVDSSGSKGITKVSRSCEVEEAIKYAFKSSRSGQIIVEEYLEKDHDYLIGGDIVIHNGKIVLYGLLNCHRNENANILVPIGKSFPLCIDEERLAVIKNELQRLITIAGIRFGVFNVELIFKEKMYILDIGARCGGNMIPQLLSNIYNIDLVEFIIKSSVGENFKFPQSKPQKGFFCSLNIHSESDGVLKSIDIDASIQENIIFKEIYKKPGDFIEFFNFSSKLLGIIFFKFKNKEQMFDLYKNIKKYVTVRLE